MSDEMWGRAFLKVTSARVASAVLLAVLFFFALHNYRMDIMTAASKWPWPLYAILGIICFGCLTAGVLVVEGVVAIGALWRRRQSRLAVAAEKTAIIAAENAQFEHKARNIRDQLSRVGSFEVELLGIFMQGSELSNRLQANARVIEESHLAAIEVLELIGVIKSEIVYPNANEHALKLKLVHHYAGIVETFTGLSIARTEVILFRHHGNRLRSW